MPKIEEKIRYIIPLSGKDSLCTALVQKARFPSFPYEYIFCDVRMELPETYAWLDRVEKTLNIKILRIGKSLEGLIDEVGTLPGHTRRFCTQRAKVYPLHDYLGTKDRVIQYLGFRADEKDRIPPVRLQQANIEHRYPLIEAGINLPLVYKILEKQQILPPSFFWQRLYDDVYDTVGPVSQEYIREMQPWTKSYLFSWRSRSNCFACFYQRLYEWVGLLEFHPDLFSRAEKLEEVYGGALSEYRVERQDGIEYRSLEMVNDSYFNMNWPLPRIREQAEKIYKKRKEDVCEAVIDSRHRLNEEVDMLATTSCGAYCGK